MDKKRFGKMILIIGITLLLLGIGLGIYTQMFGSISAYAGNTIPGWLANVIAATLAILGIVLIVLGVRELDLDLVNRRWLNS